jgi:hypothetical protein
MKNRIQFLTPSVLARALALAALTQFTPANLSADSLYWSGNGTTLGGGGTWNTVAGSRSVTAANFPISTTTPTTFYRLVYP